jgi:2-polyprenyl-3-methyl-5-hydroxy-6-metoxy-1,4-benzoquinol methylase
MTLGFPSNRWIPNLAGVALQKTKLQKLIIPSRETLSQLRSLDKEKYADALWAYADGSFIVKRLYLKRLSTMLSLLQDLPSARIIEIGAGSGILMCSLKSVTDYVVGVDLNDHLAAVRKIMMTQQGLDLDFVRSDVKHLPFRANSVDLIIGVSVLEHVPPDSLPAVMSEVNTTLNSSGHFALGYPIESPLVKAFFKSVEFDFSAEHCSKATEIRQAVKGCFKRLLKLKRLPIDGMPDYLSFYETVLVSRSEQFN